MTIRTLSFGGTALRPSFRRSELFLWVALVLFAHNTVGVVATLQDADAGQNTALASRFASIGAFQCLAWYATFRLLFESGSKRSPTRLDFAVAVALCVIDFLPADIVLWIVATAAAVYVFATSADDPKLRAAATVLMALSVQEFWGRALFNLFAFDLLRADAALVGAAMAATQDGVIWHDNIVAMPSGHGILILGACSSFHNVSLALLCAVTLTKLRRPQWVKRDFLVAGAVCATMILLNVARLYAMALGPDYFRYWHDGSGAEVFAVGASLAAVSISLYGSSREPRAA